MTHAERSHSVTTICGFRARRPAVERSVNGRVGRTRTSTCLRPRQEGYRLPNDPRDCDGVSGRNRTGTGRDTASPTGRCLTPTIETGSR